MKPIVLGDCCLIQNDCLAALRAMPDSSVDSVITDPPAGIGFVGKEWDAFRARDNFIAFIRSVMQECFRVLKPGGHALVWALPRTSHWTATAIEDAGFDVRDIIAHFFGTGFPKSHSVDKAIDREAGAEREVIGYDASRARPNRLYEGGAIGNIGGTGKVSDRTDNGATITAPATEAARRWQGWGTALAPASEHWILARKPLEGTVAGNVLKHGTGAINVDGCRVGSPSETHSRSPEASASQDIYGEYGPQETHQTEGQKLGRWPKNAILSHAPECVCIGTRKIKAIAGTAMGRMAGKQSAVYGGYTKGTDRAGEPCGYGDENGEESVELWACVPGCPVRLMDDQSGQSATKRIEKPSDCGGNTWGGTIQVNRGARGHTDTGGASRFFAMFHPFLYAAKPSKREKAAGGAVENKHPTVKGLALMRYLCRLITPPGGLVLDPFMGSGTTGIACVKEGFRFIGIEREPDYIRIAHARIAHTLGLLTQNTEVPKDKDSKEGEG